MIECFTVRVYVEPHLKRVLKVARYGHISTHNFHTLNSGQLYATFNHWLFLKENITHYYFILSLQDIDVMHIVVSDDTDIQYTSAHLPPGDVQNISGLGCPAQKIFPYSYKVMFFSFVETFLSYFLLK